MDRNSPPEETPAEAILQPASGAEQSDRLDVLEPSPPVGVVRRISGAIAVRWGAARQSPTLRTAGVNAVIMALGLATSVQLARWLGPEGRGEVAAAMLWPMLIVYLSNFGFISATLYHASLPEAQLGRILGTAWAAGLLQSMAGLTVGYFALPPLLAAQDASVLAAARMYLLVIPVSLLSLYAIGVLQARMRFRAFNALRLVTPLGYLIGVVAMQLLDHAAIRSIVLLHVVLNVIVLLGAVAVLLRYRLIDGLRADRATASRMARYGIRTHIGSVSQAANLRVDQALLTAWFPPAQLGLYIAAVSASGLLSVLTTAVQMVSVPRIARQTSAHARSAMLRNVFRRYVVIAVAGTLLLVAAMPILLPLVFGAEFAPAVSVAMVLTVAMLCLGAKEVLSGGAQAFGDPWLASRGEIAGAIVSVVLLPLVLPRLGIIGAAAVIAVAYATQLMVVALGISRAHAIPLRSLVFSDRAVALTHEP